MEYIYMEFTSLIAISPVDGRYRRVTEKLADYFSESAVIKYRLMVEVEYFIALCDLPLPQLADFDQGLTVPLRQIYKNFTIAATITTSACFSGTPAVGAAPRGCPCVLTIFVKILTYFVSH